MIRSPSDLEQVGDRLARLAPLALGAVSLLLAGSYLLRPATPAPGNVSVFASVGYSVWGWAFFGLALLIFGGHAFTRKLLRWAHPAGFALYIGFSVANIYGSAGNVLFHTRANVDVSAWVCGQPMECRCAGRGWRYGSGRERR